METIGNVCELIFKIVYMIFIVIPLCVVMLGLALAIIMLQSKWFWRLVVLVFACFGLYSVLR